MKPSLSVGDKCAVCDAIITDDHKHLLEKSDFYQTWCLSCLWNWMHSAPDTPNKNEARNFLKQNEIQL